MHSFALPAWSCVRLSNAALPRAHLCGGGGPCTRGGHWRAPAQTQIQVRPSRVPPSSVPARLSFAICSLLEGLVQYQKCMPMCKSCIHPEVLNLPLLNLMSWPSLCYCRVTMATKCWKAPSSEDERQGADDGRILVLDGIAVLLLPRT